MDQSVPVENGSKRIGDGYLDSYAEIPADRIEDRYLAAKKLAGHLRPFDPLDLQGQHIWLTSNRPSLEIAYGQETVDDFVNRIATAMLGQQRG